MCCSSPRSARQRAVGDAANLLLPPSLLLHEAYSCQSGNFKPQHYFCSDLIRLLVTTTLHLFSFFSGLKVVLIGELDVGSPVLAAAPGSEQAALPAVGPSAAAGHRPAVGCCTMSGIQKGYRCAPPTPSGDGHLAAH